jgi:PAS domain S-box-containing protein
MPGHTPTDRVLDESALSGGGTLLSALEALLPHAHLCLIYETPDEQRAAVVPFVRLGLERGERCVYVVDETTAATVLDALRNDGVDTTAAQASGALAVLTKRETYLRDGAFDPERMIAYLAESTAAARADGFAALRVTGEMTWALGDTIGADRLVEYEARLNDFLSGNECLAICQYHRSRFPAETIRDVILTHPLVIHGGGVLRNDHYLSPREFLGRDRVAREVDGLLEGLARQQQLLDEREERARSSEARYRRLYETMTQGVVYQAADGRITDANPAAQRILGLTLDQMQGRTSTDPRWRAVHEDGSDFPGDEHPGMVALRTGEPVLGVVMGVYNPASGDFRWIEINAVPESADGSGSATGVYATFDDITERRQAEADLRRIEWMLSARSNVQGAPTASATQSYGDLTALNADRTILDAVGADTLRIIAGDFLDLLGTSSAVYEKNGDYALGIFSSGWCRCLDDAARRLCATDDDAQALASGDWLCHESCWTDCSRIAIETGEPVDIECRGSLHLYAVPIRAGDEVVGVINVGYGDPPTSPEKLQELARLYRVPLERLRHEAAAYEGRPAYMVQLAKARLHSAARLIGEIVERTRIQQQLRETGERYRELVERINAGVAVYEVTEDGQDFIFRELNAAAETMDRLDRADVIGRRVTEAFPGVEEFGLLDVLRRVHRTGEPEDHPVSQYKDERLTGWRDNFVYRLPGGEVVAIYEDITERKQVEDALKDSERLWRSYFENAPYGVFIGDETGRYLQVNPEACRMTGYGEVELLGMAIPDLLPPDEMEYGREHFTRLIENGEAYGEGPFITKSGERRWWSVSATRLSASRYLGFTEDITDRRHAEEERLTLFRERADLLRSMSNAFVVFESVFDEHGSFVSYRFEYINEAYERITGVTLDEVLGKTVHEVWPETEASWIENYGAVAVSGETRRFEMFHQPTGKLYDCTVYRPWDTPDRFCVVFDDITERKRWEEALRESEDKFRYVFDRSIVGKSLTYPDGRMETNAAFLDMLGYTAEELQSRRWQEITHPDDVAANEAAIAPLLAGEQDSARFTKRYLRTDGSILWADVSTTLRRDEQGEPLYFMTALLDITKRKRAEEAVARLNAELEQRVRDRTAELEAVNTELEAFTYTVSHDLRAPLRHIAGFATLLQERAGDELQGDLQHYIARITAAVERMGRLIDELLEFSRTGRSEIKLTTVDMDRVVAEAREAVLPDAGERPIEWRIAALPNVRGDEAMLRLVWINLLDNAVKYSAPHDAARIEVGHDEDGDELVFWVRDDGVGFEQRYAGKLFGVFQRLHPPDQFAGAGIGLATVRRVIARMGGRTWADGAVDEGATFYFALPGPKGR